jgi:Retrotransposon gag protein
MAQNLVGTIPNFVQGVDDWNTYAEILDQFFVVNNIEEEKKSAFLISCIGATTYKTLRDLCHPSLPKDRPFTELAEHLRKQFSPQVAIFRERTNFYNAQQLDGETVTGWYGRLKRLSVDCKFSDNLEAVLVDKFITGLRPGQILDRLCEENESLKLQQAVDIATNKESALKDLCGATYSNPYQNQYNNQRPNFKVGQPRGHKYHEKRNHSWRNQNVETEIQE